MKSDLKEWQIFLLDGGRWEPMFDREPFTYETIEEARERARELIREDVDADGIWLYGIFDGDPQVRVCPVELIVPCSVLLWDTVVINRFYPSEVKSDEE